MTTLNAYATLAEFRDYAVANQSPDADDDAVIEKILNAASRYIDSQTGRVFYPRIETRSYSVPNGNQLWLDEDLLAVVSLTNGEGTAIAAAAYNLLPYNNYPKYAVRLTESTSVYFQSDSSSNSEYVIDLVGIWGYHEYYAARAWKLLTTLNEGGVLNATDVKFTVTSAAAVDATGGQIIKIENEMMIVRSKTGNDVTVIARGENGSTAATHIDATAIYVWAPMDEIREACLEIASSAYKRRTGENATATSVITSGGVVITPRDVPDFARAIIKQYARIV